MNSSKALLAGCGKMGGSLLRRWLSDSRFSHITVIEPFGLPAEFQNHPSITHLTSPNRGEDNEAGAQASSRSRWGGSPDIIILAVKPQNMAELCTALKPYISGALILSIAAGTPLSFFETQFGPQTPIIRTMPNTPAAIGKGATVAVANAACTAAHKALADSALSGTGLVEWITDETLMNAVTALSGSGPAYVFHLIEALEKAGTDIGLPPALAAGLARQTVIGSAALAAESPDITPATLRQNVTSPGGTTEAALKVLMNGEFQDILTSALQAAKRRGEELGG